MALESTIINDGIMVELLEINWNIKCDTYEKLKIGTANCYKIKSDNEVYFLKEFQSDIKEKDIIKEAEILDRLKKKGIPTTSIISTVTGAKFITYEKHYFVLEEFIEGETYGYYSYPKEMLPQMAEMLAKLHIALQDMELPEEMDSRWINGDVISKYENLISVLEEHKDDDLYDKIKEDLLYKCSILEKYQQKFWAYFDGITYGASHGDYQGCQIIGENNRIKAIIDFSSARKLPVVWEIMRSFVQTSQESRLDCRINVEELCKYVERYCKVNVLTVQDLHSMPYVYLFQLLRSTYGYKEYLQTNTEDRDELLAFAFWRTRICKEVLEKADEIVEGLLKVCMVKRLM